MKKLFFIFILICFFVPSVVSANPSNLYVVVDDDFPPFSFEDDGKVKGVDIDIIQEMGKRLGIEIKIDLVPWKRLLKMTNSEITNPRNFCYFNIGVFYTGISIGEIKL